MSHITIAAPIRGETLLLQGELPGLCASWTYRSQGPVDVVVTWSSLLSATAPVELIEDAVRRRRLVERYDDQFLTLPVPYPGSSVFVTGSRAYCTVELRAFRQDVGVRRAILYPTREVLAEEDGRSLWWEEIRQAISDLGWPEGAEAERLMREMAERWQAMDAGDWSGT
jgi:hypothetical protein